MFIHNSRAGRRGTDDHYHAYEQHRSGGKQKTEIMPDKLFFEKSYLAQGAKYICGVDEVGRGPLAGPVTVCAVIMDLDKIVDGVDDSKKLSEKKREKLFDPIVNAAIAKSVVSLDNEYIDEVNILNATKDAMKRAIESLDVKPDVVLVDAVNLDIPYKTHAIIKGDALSYSIGCASIIAKVTRDGFMKKLDEVYPGYGFASNKGYGSAQHIAAIKEKGPCPVHRRTFIKNFISGDEE
ncbi:MAG: ribonuclease HII [Eubacteriales bacterium]|nr:ribonuclease HII [Eubacteriales bacterium]